MPKNSLKRHLAKGKKVKQYLEKLADEIDFITTQMDAATDYQEQIIGVIYKHLQEYESTGEVTLEMILKDMRKVIE